MKHYSHCSRNDYGDVFASFPLSLLAHQHGVIYESPECYTTLSSFPEAIHDAWTGLIADGEEYICNRPTLNKLQTILREDYSRYVEVVRDINAMTYYYNITSIGGTEVQLKCHIKFDSYESCLESGLSYAIEQYIIP